MDMNFEKRSAFKTEENTRIIITKNAKFKIASRRGKNTFSGIKLAKNTCLRLKYKIKDYYVENEQNTSATKKVLPHSRVNFERWSQ
jgi:hypothetical protein